MQPINAQIDNAWLDGMTAKLANQPAFSARELERGWTGAFPSPRDEAEATGALRLPLIDPAAWEGIDPPERRWALAGWIPDRQATYLTGPGSTGKSLLGQQLATCLATGRNFLGVAITARPALYLTCEDDADELHIRQKAICKALDIRTNAMPGLRLMSLVGDTANELCRTDDGQVVPTPRFGAIAGVAKMIGARLVVLDNVAHLFSGNENIRHDVAAFVSLLNRLAIMIDGAVLFIGHPNKAGDSFSGSTAWENQVRSRLYLETPANSDGTIPDRDARLLSRKKANYAQNGETLAFRWHEWAFMRDEDLSPEHAMSLAVATEAAAGNAAFLACLDKATLDRRAVSHVNGTNYAPRIFARMIEGKGWSFSSFESAMERLLHLGMIELDKPLWTDAHRHWKNGIRRAKERGDPPAATPCGVARRPPLQVIENTAATLRAATPLYPTDKQGDGPDSPTPRSTMILAPGETGDDVDL